jgi:hypothetical protein
MHCRIRIFRYEILAPTMWNGRANVLNVND